MLRYVFLSVITLLLFTACGDKSESYSQISSDEAIAIVKDKLESFQWDSRGGPQNCLSTFKNEEERRMRAYPVEAIEQEDGNWEVTWTMAGAQNTFKQYKWIVYPMTQTVSRIDTENSVTMNNKCPR